MEDSQIHHLFSPYVLGGGGGAEGRRSIISYTFANCTLKKLLVLNQVMQWQFDLNNLLKLL
jgi:hypothetical protein